jgi:hypothetical protein
MPIIPAPRRWRWEDYKFKASLAKREFQASLGYKMRPYLQKIFLAKKIKYIIPAPY